MSEHQAGRFVEHTFPELPAGSRGATQRLDNGLQLLAVEVPTARQVRLVGAVGGGYLDEPAALPGLAHLLEHALFLGSRNASMPGEFAAWVGEQGGRYNARTDERVTDVHVTLPPEAARVGLVRLLDLLTQPCLDESAIAREVNVLDAEFKARLADPAFHRQAALSRFFLPSHPAYTCHAGNQASLDASPRELRRQLAAFHASHYRSERMSLVMLGPMALVEQLSMLRAAGRGVPSGTHSLAKAESWRWGIPAHLQWCLPEALPERAPTLELLWPLPPEMAEKYQGPLRQVASALCDGSLAQTLLEKEAISDMDVSLAAEATGTALSLSLVLRDRGKHQVEEIVATCQAALGKRLAQPWRHSSGPVMTEDLDQWTLLQARRLARQLPPLRRNKHSWAEKGSELSQWLASSACRVLEEVNPCEFADDRTAQRCRVPETRTLFREVRYATHRSTSPCVGSCLRTAPIIAAQPSISDAIAPSPGRLETQPLSLWWGGGPKQKGASWCLGWPATSSNQHARLAIWRQRTLAIRQAAWTRGLEIKLGGDGLGDWVMSRGPAAYLESAIALACEAWPSNVAQACASRLAPVRSGLLAQRLLAELETASPVVGGASSAEEPLSAGLSWVDGELSVAQVREGCQRLATLLPSGIGKIPQQASMSTEDRESLHWVAPQAEDFALMLQIDGPDASPMSRLLMKLLGWCHDAAFFKELRQRQGVGYVAAVRYREADGWPRLGYVVQSPHTDIEALQKAVTGFIDEQAMTLANLDAGTMARRRDSLHAVWGAPETQGEATLACWQALRAAVSGAQPWPAANPKGGAFRLAPWETMTEALQNLTEGQLTAFTEALVRREFGWRWWAHAPSEE